VEAGIGIDGDTPDSPLILFKQVGKVKELRKLIAENEDKGAEALEGRACKGGEISISLAHTHMFTGTDTGRVFWVGFVLGCGL
jgi:hypothetical protein